MVFFKRSDGAIVKGLDFFRRSIPFVMRTRSESVIYTVSQIKIENLLKYRKTVNVSRKEGISLFSFIVFALLKTLEKKPELNRFISGKNIYQRSSIEFCFITKKKLTLDADETNVKLTLEASETIDQVNQKMNDGMELARSGVQSRSDKELKLLMKFPQIIIRFVMRFMKWLDYHNLMPSKMIKMDPLYCSVYVANLGSLGINKLHHHLYEWGNCPIFMVIGKIIKEPVINKHGEIEVSRVINLSFTLDERISDGFYFKSSIDLLKDLLENPEKLEIEIKNKS